MRLLGLGGARAALALGALACGALARGAGVSAEQAVTLDDALWGRSVACAGCGSWLVLVSKGAVAGSHKAALDGAVAALAGTGIGVGTVDLSATKSAGGKFRSAGFKLFGPDRAAAPKELAKGRDTDAAAVVLDALDAVRETVTKRLGPSAAKFQQGKQHQHKQAGGKGARGKPLELTDATFDDVVLKSDDAFLVAFVAPWCGHCKALEPEYDKAALALEGSGVVIARVDATANERLAQRFGIQGFPTIKFFGPFKDQKAAPLDYQLERKAEAIQQWGLQQFDKMGGKANVEIVELTSQAHFDELCARDGKCVLAILPDIRDSGKAGRDQLIEQVREAQRSARHVAFAWLAAGSQPKLEAAYHLSFGFPAVLYLREHAGVRMGTHMKAASLSAASLSAFASSPKGLNDFSQAGWPAIDAAEPWDGNEAPQDKLDEDDFDLDEFLRS
jgi:protein disulfide-isomerase A6